MKRDDLENMKEKVPCATILCKAGFAVDVRESTRRAVKWRREAEIIIATHDGRGWFDPLSDAKGDVFSLVTHLDGGSFTDALAAVAYLVGAPATVTNWKPSPHLCGTLTDVSARWAARQSPWRGSSTWTYLSQQRFLPLTILRAAIDADALREGPHGSMWAVHTDDDGTVSGWEERGPAWRGFASGGSKVLFRLGSQHATRLCVVEAAIDAMSLAAIEGVREGTLYLSTGGGWSPRTDAALRSHCSRPGTVVIAATDANVQGDVYADRLRSIAEETGCGWQRLRPPTDDWNEVLKLGQKEKQERKRTGRREGDLPHSRQPRQGRLRPGKPGP